MLKIIKYDWKNGWNSVRVTLLIAAVLSVIVGLGLGRLGGHAVVDEFTFAVVGEASIDKIVVILSTVWFAVMLALLVLTVDTICRNMSGRMFGPEGYLTHTLPVSTVELLLGKAVGTWLFGVFMVFVAIFCPAVLMLNTAASTGDVLPFISSVIQALPKLGSYHFQQVMNGIGYVMYGVLAFLAGSFLVVLQFQFICIAARLFGRFHLAGSVIVFWLLCYVEGNLNQALSMGFVIVTVSSAACFAASCWLLKHKLNI